MVVKIFKENEIALNGKTYTIKPPVLRSDISQFPSKLVMGDTTYDDEPVLSNWIISDQRGGIGKEYASPKDLTRCWWSTCDLDHEGHLLPPPLATAFTLPSLPTINDGGLETWVGNDNTAWTETVSGGTVTKETTTIHGGAASAKLLTQNSLNAYAQIAQTFTTGWSNNLRGATIRVGLWVNFSGGGSVIIYDGVDTTTVTLTGSGWTKNFIAHKINVAATGITVTVKCLSDGTAFVGYVDDIAWDYTSDVNFCYENFNNGTYNSKGSILYRVDSSTGEIFFQAMLPQKITSLKATVGTNLAIGQGDSYVWYYLTAAGGTLVNVSGIATGAPITLPINRTTVTVTTLGTFTVTLPAGGTGTATSGTTTVTGSPQALVAGANTVTTTTATGTFTIDTFAVLTVTDKTGAHFCQHWNDLFVAVNTSGQCYTTATLEASPTMATKGKIKDGSTLNWLELYHDTSLALQVYCGTSNGVWVHDWTNAKWYKANVKYAAHPNAGKGLLSWNANLYISAGIHVKKYSISGSVASSTSVGLDVDDGLPIKVASTGTNYIGEFTSFIDDNECFYGTMDSTQYGTNGYSWIAKYTGYGWQVLWATTTLNQAMYGGIVGTVYTRRLYFDCGATLYSIPLPRVNISPKQISTSTYAASAVHITPWFNGGSQVNDKLAQAIKTFCKDITTTETVTVSYRTNRTNTDLDTGWTELVVLNSTGENNKVETALASGVGVSQNLIQLRFDLVRGDTTTTAPDLQSYSLSYQKWLPIKGSYSFTVVAEEGKQAPREIETNLLAARASVTLVEFNYRDGSLSTDTHYVRVLPFTQRTPTGLNYTAEYVVTVIEL